MSRSPKKWHLIHYKTSREIRVWAQQVRANGKPNSAHKAGTWVARVPEIRPSTSSRTGTRRYEPRAYISLSNAEAAARRVTAPFKTTVAPVCDAWLKRQTGKDGKLLPLNRRQHQSLQYGYEGQQ